MYRVVVAVLVVVFHAVTATGAELECPAVTGTDVPNDVVARTQFGAGRYDLDRTDRVCRPKEGPGLGALRSRPVHGAQPARNVARNQVALSLIDGLIDVDVSTPIAILFPENVGQPAYGCYRLLDELPTSRLCVLADVDGSGLLTGKALLCNRGRCRERKVLGRTVRVDQFESVWDAAVTPPGAAEPIAAVVLTRRGKVGRLTMDVYLDVHDAMETSVDLRARGRWVFDGSVLRDATPILTTSGRGRARVRLQPNRVTVDSELTDTRGTTSITMEREGADDPTVFGEKCWLLAMTDDQGVRTTTELPLVVPATGIGASRATTEDTEAGETRSTLGNGDCAVTPTGRLACLIPATSGDVSFDLRLFGALQVATTMSPASGQGTFTDLVTPRSGTWTATVCPSGG